MKNPLVLAEGGRTISLLGFLNNEIDEHDTGFNKIATVL